MSNIVNITNEQIEELRKKGLSYRAIANYFTEQGIKVSFQAIEQRCRAIYKMKHETETSEISDEEIYNQREKRSSYKAISEYFESKGKKISPSTIKKRCKEIYRAKRGKEPRTKYIPRKISDELDDEIFKLREKRLSYKAISEYFEEQGKKISSDKIRLKCKGIYKRRKKKEPNAKSKAEVISDISDDEIYGLADKKEPRAITRAKAEKKSSETIDTIYEESLREGILRLQETKGATTAQIEQIAKLYGIDLSEKLHNDER